MSNEVYINEDELPCALTPELFKASWLQPICEGIGVRVYPISAVLEQVVIEKNLLLSAIKTAFELIQESDRDEFLETYPDQFAVCVWCRESNEPCLHLEEDMSACYDDELGGLLCKECSEEATAESGGGESEGGNDE